MIQFPQSLLEKLHSSIHVLQEQDNQTVGEAMHLFAGIRLELEA
jgi:hypothetical protein